MNQMLAIPRFVRKNVTIYEFSVCRLCGVGYGERRPDHACPVSICQACGTPQCLYNGLGRGQCSICFVGLLDGYSARRCGYAGCKDRAITAMPRVGYACRMHATSKGRMEYVASTYQREIARWVLKP